MKKIALILSAISLCSSIGIASSIYAFNKMYVNDSKVNISSEKENTEKDKTPIDYVSKSPILTQKTGPIISFGSKISALDWYGSTLWSFDFNDKKNNQYYPGENPKNHPKYVNRSFLNWSLDYENNILWVLTNSIEGRSETKPQNVLKIDSLTGEIIKCIPMKDDKPKDDWHYYYNIQVLESGNVLIYSQGNSNWGKNYLLDSKTYEFTFSDSKTKEWDQEIKNKMNTFLHNNANGQIRMLHTIPIMKNINIAIFCDFNDQHKINKGTGDLFLQLVDDNLKEITVNNSSLWSKMIHIPINVEDNKGYKSDNFSKTIYTRLDNKVYFTAWNKFFIFFPENDNGGGIKFKEFNLPHGKEKRILSYTMDVNENLFVKYWDDTHIYKYTITGETPENMKIDTATYYDIGSNQEQLVKENANKYVLYNVSGYSGSIMMLSSKIYENLEHISDSVSEQDKNYLGIAVAIVPNKNNYLEGDSKGLLNTEKSFLKTSDFTIDDEILKTKMPSEITRNDLNISNGFLTNNKKVNDKNELLYPAFQLENIKDELGSFDVVANINQIPWFTNKLPTDAIPKTIKKSFDRKALKISEKVSWKKENELPYDFKNMLPSDVKTSDLNEYDLFQVSFNSRVVLETNGNQKYPKKTYIINGKNDDDGTITIGIKYEYVPVSDEVNKLLTYQANQTFNIFKNNDEKQLFFAGSNSKAEPLQINKEINIKDVPQLKELSESSLLPSSFNGKDKNSFLQFINTNKSKGYPISRMEFNVEPNDNDGYLTIIAKYKDQTFRQKYIEFNKLNDYSFSTLDKKVINGKPFKTILPSSINDGNVIEDLIQYSGFNSSDFNINLFPNDEKGILNIKIELNRDYSKTLGNKFGFSNYFLEKQYNEFMTTSEYNNKFNITFRENGDKQLANIKKYTLQAIQQKINSNEGLVIENTKYDNLNDLVEELFVKNKGTNIPKNWGKNNKITTKMAFNNQAGAMNLSISIDKSLLDGYESNLNYVISYSGFANGNIDETGESLSFIDQSLLKNIVTEIQDMKASQMAEWLKTKSNLLRIIFTYSGQYVDFIQKDEYKLITQTNDAYGEITITIKFTGKLDNNNSLSEYSVQYNLYH